MRNFYASVCVIALLFIFLKLANVFFKLERSHIIETKNRLDDFFSNLSPEVIAEFKKIEEARKRLGKSFLDIENKLWNSSDIHRKIEMLGLDPKHVIEFFRKSGFVLEIDYFDRSFVLKRYGKTLRQLEMASQGANNMCFDFLFAVMVVGGMLYVYCCGQSEKPL